MPTPTDADLDGQLEALLIRCPACRYAPGICSVDTHVEDLASEITYALVDGGVLNPAHDRYAREHILDVLRKRQS